MKVALSADWQFDEYPNLSTVLPNGLTSRLQNVMECFKWHVDEALRRGCEKLINDGDMFESRTSIPLPVIQVACQCIQYASNGFGDDNVHIVVGNHDSYLRSPDINSVVMFEGFATVHDRPCMDPPFAFVPWTDDEEQMAAMVEQVAKEKRCKYLVTHCLVQDIYPTGGIRFATLKPKRWKRVLLGDVHQPGEFKNALYIGAPMQFDFGDAGGERGFRILDTESGEVEFVENTFSPRFHKVEEHADVKAVRDVDFVRTDDLDLADAVAKQSGTAHIECRDVKLDDPAPRLDVKSRDPHEEVLQRYCDHMGVEDESLVELGLDIIEEAGNG